MTKKKFDEMSDEFYFALIRLSRQDRTNKNFYDMNLNEILKIERDYNIKLNYAAVKRACFDSNPRTVEINFDIKDFLSAALDKKHTVESRVNEVSFQLSIERHRTNVGYAYFMYDAENRQIHDEAGYASQVVEQTIGHDELYQLVEFIEDMKRTYVSRITIFDNDFKIEFVQKEAKYYSLDNFDDNERVKLSNFSITKQGDVFICDEQAFETNKLNELIDFLSNR
ncbi:MAG: hypothetical protein ACRC17_02085 [Culicoidibacterales bacterium]